MSSVSDGLGGYNISIPAADGSYVEANPGTLNKWLQLNDGYDDSDDLIESVVPQIDPGRITWPEDGMYKTKDGLTYELILQWIEAGRVVIANVLEGHHFVLSVGGSEDGDTIEVHDPGFDTANYSYTDDVVGFRIFDMS
mmetsp:Transcript_27552/g.74975  ORF Transcript_27552/g.74975 Transcript_27552/m.74975 type:complete len:139 (-) Transcript_27552:125-541(-)